MAQYVKAVLTILLSLYSTRLILDALDVNDYGIYSVVGGAVSMLGFIVNAMVVTTQRYISFYIGRGDTNYVKKLFSNSLLLHLLIGAAIALLLLLAEDWLMSVLKINPDRMGTARMVYVITTMMLLITIIMAPFKALFIAREKIVYIAIVEIADAFIKLSLAIWLSHINSDKLLFYALMMASIQLLNLLAYAGYSRWKFAECRFTIHRRDIDRKTMSSIFGFAGWSTYGMGSIAARNQGIAVILNHFFGTAINAAYGLAFQIYSSMAFVSSSILNAMNPQIMKAEGADEHDKMLKLASKESKYSVALMAIVSIPVMMEMSSILEVWIKREVPSYTAMISTFILVSFLIDQLTIGLHAVNQAQGNIRNYSLLMFTPKLLNLPLAYFMLLEGCSVESVMWSYLIIETLVAIARLPYLKRTAGLSISSYVHYTVWPLVPLFVASIVTSWLCIAFLHMPFRFLITVALAVSIASVTAWRFTLLPSERTFFVEMIKQKLRG
ncbi:MAG: hypothetical protein IKT00_12475 [Prevotella sp.]|nr:hypothetical protein [Prevotella sp.]